jgi:hypothetical protein
MKSASFAIAVAWCLAAPAGLALDEHRQPVRGASEFIEGFNPNHPVRTGGCYGHALYAWRYACSVTYDIDRIEFIHGDCGLGTGIGTVRIEVRTAGLSAEFPLNTTILTSGEYEQVAEITFQGADLPPVRLTPGFYWIVLAPVVPSQTSKSDPVYDGDWVYMCYSDDDGATWTCPEPNAGSLWIAHFFGTRIVSVERNIWAGIKLLYR